MISNDLPQVKTVKLLFIAMDEQQQAMFKMAFKMHNTTNYEVISPTSGDKPELVIVDGDSSGGVATWQKAKADYRNSTVVFFSESPPSVTAPYLAKPIKFDTLFLSLRNLLKGNGVWVVRGGNNIQPAPAKTKSEQAPSSPQNATHRATELIIPRFDPDAGLLGAFRKAIYQQKNTVLLVDGKPALAVFPSISRVWVAINSEQLKTLCRQNHITVEAKSIPEDNNMQERANATIISTLWQMALWTANGRLVQPLTPQSVFRLRGWPNLTRLAPLPESLRLSAFLTKTAVNLNMLYKLLPLDMSDILNYIAATYLTDYLVVTQQNTSSIHTTQYSSTQATVDTSATPNEEQMRAAGSQQAANKQSGQSGLLGRLMKKLLNK